MMNDRNQKSATILIVSIGVGASDYTNPEKIYLEIQYAERIYRKGNFGVLLVSEKPIETSADVVVRMVTNQLRT